MSSYLKVMFERYFRRYNYSRTTKDCERGLQEALEAAGRQKWCRNWPLLFLIPAALYFYTEATGAQHRFPKLSITPHRLLFEKLKQSPKSVAQRETIEDPDGAVIRRHTYKYKLKRTTTPTNTLATTTAATAGTAATDTQHYCGSTSGTTSGHNKFKLQLSNIPESLDDIYPLVLKGGYYKLEQCIPKHKVAILVPYRNNSPHLKTFLYNIHPFLMAQQIEYQIFVIEQYGDIDFNKGRLFNAGFLELSKPGQRQWSCLVLHNADLLPASLNVSYACPPRPKHLSCAIDRDLKKTNSSKSTCGGVCILPVDQYQKVNGYSNMYWELGGEDADFGQRLSGARLQVAQCNKQSEQYVTLSHEQTTNRPHNKLSRLLLYSARDRNHCEGLKSTQYQLISVEKTHLFTRLLVNVDQYGEMKELHFKDVVAPGE